jgi:catechol 2,3-dioxygenase-like lactoylglutathione lyase family enzyme
MASEFGRIVAIDHVQLAMPAGGEAAARAFYEGVLGLDEVPKPAALAGRGGAGVERVHVTDPFGNRIELLEPVETSRDQHEEMP